MIKYLNIPFKDKGRDETGVDCWGLVYLYYINEYNVKLDDHCDAYENTQDLSIADRVDKETETTWQQIITPQSGDVVLVRMRNRPMHVGIYCGDGLMMHIEENNTPTIEKLGSIKWSKRVLGYYRLKSLMSTQ